MSPFEDSQCETSLLLWQTFSIITVRNHFFYHPSAKRSGFLPRLIPSVRPSVRLVNFAIGFWSFFRFFLRREKKNSSLLYRIGDHLILLLA